MITTVLQEPFGWIPESTQLIKIQPSFKYYKIMFINWGILQWLKNIDMRDSKLFTLNHCPIDHALHFYSKFKRQVIITHILENPILVEKYHNKLQTMHSMEEIFKD